MKKQLDGVKKFHEVFGSGMNDSPSNISEQRVRLRYDLMKEELEEYKEAAEKKSLVDIADALGDKLYILCGTIIEHGMQHIIEDVFDEIQRSNMSKLGADGKPVYRDDGKVLKGPGYSPPDIKKILNKE